MDSYTFFVSRTGNDIFKENEENVNLEENNFSSLVFQSRATQLLLVSKEVKFECLQKNIELFFFSKKNHCSFFSLCFFISLEVFRMLISYFVCNSKIKRAAIH